MSFTETTMFGRLIWGSELSLDAAARHSGWSRADLAWETLQEDANRAFESGNFDETARKLRRARLTAMLFFPTSDLRRATSTANLGILDMAGSRTAKGRVRLETAIAHWHRHAAKAVETMQIAPRARSSLFHLRMEALHRDDYHANIRLRIGRMTAEACETMQAHLDGIPAPHRHFGRWKGERPSIHDDTRKVLAACLLLLAKR